MAKRGLPRPFARTTPGNDRFSDLVLRACYSIFQLPQAWWWNEGTSSRGSGNFGGLADGLCRDFGGTHVKKALMLSAAAVFGLATAGHADEMAYAKKPSSPFDSNAADLSYKAKAPAAPADDSLCWHGVCLYGQIDYGLTYQSHGAPLNNLAGSPVFYLI